MTDPTATPTDPDECPQSKRIDGPLHSWVFDGDDPYVVCAYCGERRDAHTGRVIVPVGPADPQTGRWTVHRGTGVRNQELGATLWCHDDDQTGDERLAERVAAALNGEARPTAEQAVIDAAAAANGVWSILTRREWQRVHIGVAYDRTEITLKPETAAAFREHVYRLRDAVAALIRQENDHDD